MARGQLVSLAALGIVSFAGYQAALSGALGEELKQAAEKIQSTLFPPDSPEPVPGECPFIPGSRYVAETGSPPAYTVWWRGKPIMSTGLQTKAENFYNELCASDPY